MRLGWWPGFREGRVPGAERARRLSRGIRRRACWKPQRRRQARALSGNRRIRVHRCSSAANILCVVLDQYVSKYYWPLTNTDDREGVTRVKLAIIRTMRRGRMRQYPVKLEPDALETGIMMHIEDRQPIPPPSVIRRKKW